MDVGDSSADETNNLVLDEQHPDPSGRGGKKYMVTGGYSRRRRLSRNQWICVGVGVALVIMLIVVVGVGLGVWAAGRSGGSESDGDQWKNVRLPSSITPEGQSINRARAPSLASHSLNLSTSLMNRLSDYTIHLTADIAQFTVSGSSTINLNVHNRTSLILIHVKEMNISLFKVSQNGRTIAVETNFTYEENNYYVIRLASQLSIGTAKLMMNFDYSLAEGLVGFYRSSYMNSDGEKKWIGTTQFEPTDARKAFPCFDEPAMKANFTFSITHSSDLNAHSNMPVESWDDSSKDGMITTHFQTSVKMSTYLVAFVVSDFQCISNLTTTGVNVSVCSNPAVLNNTQYALERAVEILEFYEVYYNQSYPLPKQDLFAIPDFAAGAMENWGLITYRETALLYNPAINPESSKQRVAVVIAHELAHQWFGNLVTMEWWDGLWLNEGFATYTEYIGTNATEPSFHILDEFLTDDLFVALAVDGVNETHPIIQTVSNPNEINELFDSISYSKGGSVVRMIRNVLTPEKFQRGITTYLERSKFGNARTDQLWDALQTVVEDPNDLNVTVFMNTWTLQMGYPVVTVDTQSGQVTQERFFIVKPDGPWAPSPYNYTWMIPFSYVTEKNSSEQFLTNNFRIITKKKDTVKFPDDSGFILVNVDHTGFFRVNYDLSNWYDIIGHLRSNPNSQVIGPGDRATLIDDIFALSSAGILDVRLALNLSQYVRDETEYVPLATTLSSLASIGSRLSLTPVYGLFQEFVRNLTSNLVERLPFNETDLLHLQYYMRIEVLNAAWSNGNSQVIKTATELFQNWMKYNISVDPNLKSVVYPVGIAYGGDEEWDFMWQQYVTSSDPYEKRLFLSALGKSQIPWILNRYLEYAIDQTKVRSQDTSTVIAYIASNINGRYLAWSFFRNNWDTLLERYGGGSFSFSRMIKYVTGRFYTEVDLEEVKRFFEEKEDHGSGERAIKQTLETIQLNILWLKTNRDLLYACLSDTITCFSNPAHPMTS